MAVKNIKLFALLLLVAVLGSGCIGQKNVAYFQTANAAADSASFVISNLYTATIQPSDILSIDISSLSPEASLMVNPHLPMQAANVAQQATQYNNPPAAIGYLVDNEGKVTIPLIGKVKVAGLTTFVAADTITRRFDNLLVQPTVNVRILNFKISVLGEVVRPAVYTIPNEKVSIPEAIAMAGDLTIYAKRDNILLIREVNGKRTFNRIDLTQRMLFNSPNYFLHPNDILYVEPGKGRITSSDRSIQLAPIIISGLTLIATLLIATLKK